jgi:hypothetical protein
MKRVQIGQDGFTVDNVTVLAVTSPAGTGNFVDVADGVVVAPGFAWNGNHGSPSFSFGPAPTIPTNDTRLSTLEANMPTAASSVPPAVGDAGALGSAAAFARGDHTHASKVRKQRVTGITAATYAWTYPVAFAAGVVPIVQAIAEDPSNSASDCYNIQVVGAPTATQTLFRIIRQTSGLFGLLLGAIGFNSTPGTINLNLIALEP